MADNGLSPPPIREPLVERTPLTPTATWSRWLDLVRGSVTLTQAQLATLQADLDALEAVVAALTQPQVTTLTVAVAGTQVLTFAALAPAGATVQGVTWRIATTFTGGVTGLLVGDAVVNDRYGVASAVTAGTTGGSAAWRGQGGFPVASAYTVLVALTGGAVGAAGAVTCHCTWLPALLPPP